jgi:adenine-specific DNA-methyltransferase
MLLDEIFGEKNRLGTVVIVHNPRGRNDDKYFATMHEYGLFYAKNKDLAHIKKFEFDEEGLSSQFPFEDEISKYGLVSYMRTGNNSNRDTRPNLFYPIYWDGERLSLEKTAGSKKVLPVNARGEEKTWRWSRDTFLRDFKTEILVKETRGVIRLYKKRRPEVVGGSKPKTVWYEPRYDASSHGVVLLDKLFNKRGVFPYPKSLYAVMDALKITSAKESVILDFFAGSGTTGHAVLKLNEEDGGSRRFILCTNNENDIASEVCYPRVAKIMQGYKGPDGKKVAGLGGNLKYFKTAFVGAEPNDKNKEILTREATEMLCMREDTFDVVKETKLIKIFKGSKRHTGIVFDEDTIAALKKDIAKIGGKWSVYIFSLSDDTFDEEFEDMKKTVTVAPIPEAILRVYRRIFQK